MIVGVFAGNVIFQDGDFYVDDNINVQNDLIVEGNVGIGTSSPESRLHVVTGDAGIVPDTRADEIVAEGNGDSGISILHPAANIGRLYFGNPTDGDLAYGISATSSTGSDTLTIINRGREMIKIGTLNNMIFNEGGFDYDFRFESDSNPNMFFIDGGTNRVGIGTSSPSYPLEVQGSSSGVSIYAQHNISASNYLYHTSVYDKSQGSALDKIKDADDLITNGKIDHTKFVGYAGEVELTDYSRPIEEEVCNDVEDEEGNLNSECSIEVTYPYTKMEKQVSLNAEVDVLRQAVYELKLQNQNLIQRIETLESKI